MEITDLVQRGKSEVYKVFVDGEFYCLLQAETLLKNKIKKGVITDKQQLDLLKKQSDNLTCKSVALKFVSKCLKSKKQVIDYLKNKGYDFDIINETISSLENYGYINDEYYANAFVKSKQNQKGKNYLKMALKQKGISDNIICNLQFETDESQLEVLAKKYIKNKPKDNLKQKLYRFLISKGFEYDEVAKVCKKVIAENDDDWN